MTFKRYLKKKYLYLYRKIVREEASPSFIAKGWAIGMFYGCLIPFGIQLLLSIPTAIILKGSKIGACIGTLITNHFTIFLIYPIQCYVGSLIIGKNLSYDYINEAMSKLIANLEWDTLLEMGTDILASFFVGGLLLALIMTPLTYFFIKRIVEKHRKGKPEKK